MNNESLKTPEQTKEATYQSWIAEFNGAMWLNKKAMPEGVYKAVQMYEHLLSHGHTIDSLEVKKESEDFSTLTGYDVADFLKYKDELEQKLIIDKK